MQLSDRRGDLVVCAAALLVMTGCSSSAVPTSTAGRAAAGPATPRVGWTPLPPSPLSARQNATAAWVAGRVLVFGGDMAPCPPAAGCAMPPEDAFPTDTAAYDPKTNRWTRTADVPAPSAAASAAVVDDLLYAWFEGRAGAEGVFAIYDPETDRWRRPSTPDVGPAGITLTAAGSAVVGYRASHDHGHAPDLLFDPRDGTWRGLPRDPLGPMFDRTMVGLDDGRIVLLGLPLVAQPNGPEPSLYGAAVLDAGHARWSVLPPSEVVGSDPTWVLSDGLVVNPAQGSLDGGEANPWGRSYRAGGALDPVTGRWLAVPEHDKTVGPFGALRPVAGHGSVFAPPWALTTSTMSWQRMTPLSPLDGLDAAAATWAGDRLIVWGGVRHGDGMGTLTGDGWAWTP